MTVFTCTKCHHALPESEFSVNTKGGVRYRRTECKRCLFARAALSYQRARMRAQRWTSEVRALERRA